VRVWPCFIIVLARNWPKLPNPTMPILRLWEEDEVDMIEKQIVMVSGKQQYQRIFPANLVET